MRDHPAQQARGVHPAHDRRDDPTGRVREEVVGGVVDHLVLDDDDALFLDRLLDHALPDLVAREGDDEGRDADERYEGALERPDRSTRGNGEQDGHEPRDLMPGLRQRHLGDDHPRDAADVADREVDLADQEDEDDAVGEQRHTGHLRDDVAEVAGAEEVVGLEREEGRDDDQPDQHRPAAEVPGADVVADPSEEALVGGLLPGGRSARAHEGSVSRSGAVDGMPDTFVGTPAVIAWTTSCWVVASRS